jgi:hypothetical protein
MADDAIRDILERSIDELPDELRAVFTTCVVDGITPEQCAELFALTRYPTLIECMSKRNFQFRRLRSILRSPLDRLSTRPLRH